ncbi:MAG: branched-chain amino acid ABC transporter permease [Planctomycetes bacterium]|jgi:branched-chain amino acid transport system permease protein|nr:branched-chain amino acid ABC transporter permease [Planctomycetota bacterium]
MKGLRPALNVLLLGVTAAAVTFPIASIRWRQDRDMPATITADALRIGIAVCLVGWAALGLGALVRRLRRTEVARAAAGLATRPAPRIAFLGLLAVVLLALPFVASRQIANLAVETCIYAVLALGLNVMVGYAGLLVLGYAAFFAIGAYTFALLALRLGLGLWVSLPAAGAVAMLAGLLIGLPSLRLRGDYLAIVTLGFGEVVYYFLRTEVALTGGEFGLPNKDLPGDLQKHTSLFGSGPLLEPTQWYWPALGLLLLAVFVIRRVERSRVGRALMALREDETAARCMGIDTMRLKLSAFAFAAMWAGFAGVLWAGKRNYADPRSFDFMQSIMILAMVVLGGLGSIPGAILGAVLLHAGPSLLRNVFPGIQEYRLLIFGGLMVLLMVYRPQGLLGSARLRLRAPPEGAPP